MRNNLGQFIAGILPTVLISLSITLLSNNVMAYEGVNECDILKSKMRAQFSELSLDEPYKNVSKRFGVDYEFFEDGAVRIMSIHADLSDKLYEQDIDASLLEGAIVESINGVVVKSISSRF